LSPASWFKALRGRGSPETVAAASAWAALSPRRGRLQVRQSEGTMISSSLSLVEIRFSSAR
jgi:hypothetical protein